MLTANEFATVCKENFLTEEKLNEYRTIIEKQKVKCTKIKMKDRDYMIQVEYSLSGKKLGMQPSDLFDIDRLIIDIDNIIDVGLSYNNDGRMEIMFDYTGNDKESNFYMFQHMAFYIDGADTLHIHYQHKDEKTKSILTTNSYFKL